MCAYIWRSYVIVIGFFYQEFISESIRIFLIFEKVSGIELSGIFYFQILSGIKL